MLVVDDSPDFLESAVEFLGTEPGIHVVGQAASGRDALEQAAALVPDLVLMDVAMPDMSGIEATRRLKERPDAPKVLLVSMYDSAEHRRAAEAAGADGYVGKWEFAASVAGLIRHLVPPTATAPLDPRAARLRTLAHLHQTISASLDVDEVLLAIARAARELMETTDVSCWVADPVARTLTRLAFSNPDAAALETDSRPTTLRYGQGLVGQAAATGRVFHAPDVERDEHFRARVWARAHGIRSALAVPVMLGGELLAVLVLVGPRPFALGPEEHDLLGALTAQAAAAFRNARLHDEVRRSRDFLRSVAENLADAIVATDIAGRLTYFSPAAEEMFGIRAEQVVGVDIRELFSHWIGGPAEIQALEGELRAGRSIRNHPTRFRAADGRLLDATMSVAPLRDAAGGALGVVATLRDVTEQRRTEEALRHAETLTTMGQLLAGLAHELNNPLSVLLGESELLAAVGDPQTRTAASQMVRAAQRCARIVRNFLALARRQSPERTAVTLNEVVREAIELLSYQFRVDSIRVETELAEGLPVLTGDPHQLHQIVINLLTNAHQAMGTVAGPRRLRVGTREDGGHVVLEVADSGPGVPEELRTRIFEPFFTTKPPGQGTGLGLSLCHGIVTTHGGQLSVGSAPEGGALFTVELPATPGAPAAATPSQPVREVRPLRILVVDDEAEVAEAVVDWLGHDGHRAEVASSGASGLERLRGERFELVLCDMRMPGMDGPTFLEALRQSAPTLARRIILMTGDALAPDTEGVLREAGVPVLSKPFGLADLRRAIAALMDAAASGETV